MSSDGTEGLVPHTCDVGWPHFTAKNGPKGCLSLLTVPILCPFWKRKKTESFFLAPNASSRCHCLSPLTSY